jgi:hypothetical protein
MPPSSVPSYDDWDPDSHLPVIEEAAPTVFYGDEEEAVEQVAARLPSPPGRPKTFGSEPSQQSALAEPVLSSVPSHPKTAGCAMVRGDGRIHCRYCEHERHSPVLCLVCQERLNGPADYMKHLKTIQHLRNLGPPPRSLPSGSLGPLPSIMPSGRPSGDVFEGNHEHELWNPITSPKWKQLPPFKAPPPKAPESINRSSGSGSGSGINLS